MRTITPRIPRRLAHPFLTLPALLLALLPAPAQARWERLVRTGPYDVAFDADSVCSATDGRLGVWLRFTPRGDTGRRLGAAEYGNKAYRLHLAYYEIDCGDDSALLGMRDIMGKRGKRLFRQTGGGRREAIVPGSELDQVAQRICPAVEENGSDGTDETAGGSAAPAPETGMTEQARQRIAEAAKRAGAEASSPAAWTELGNAYFDADMPRQAIEAYDRSLALKPDNADVLNDQGAMFRQTGDLARALKNFEKVLALDPHNLEGLYNEGYMYAFDLHDIERAREIWQRYLELDQGSETARQVQSFVERYGSRAPVSSRRPPS
ncbi:MAG TPA: tetratricopeptide repeat protein [Desulfuromonadaceae bacterium]